MLYFNTRPMSEFYIFHIYIYNFVHTSHCVYNSDEIFGLHSEFRFEFII